MGRVSLRNVRKSFGTVDVIKGVDLDVDDGEFLVFVGPSGCGKSTMLRMIAGLESIDGGDLLIDGQRANDVRPADRGAAMVFQNYALYPYLTVEANIAFPLRIAKVKKSERARRVRDVAELLGLTEYLQRKPGQLSGGQRQRVAMGRAIVRDPQVFLFDEPLSNLDAKLRVAMRSEIKELHQRLKTTSVYVTHDQIEAMTMGDKIVVMKDGRIEQTGSPLELYDHPANLFVAGFIGSPAMNFLPGTLRRANGAATVELGDGTRVQAPSSAGGADGQPVIMGMRPEHLALAAAGIPSKVVVVEPTGADTFVACRHAGADLSVVFRERHDFAPGTTIHLQPDLQHAHLFDAGTGQRLAA